MNEAKCSSCNGDMKCGVCTPDGGCAACKDKCANGTCGCADCASAAKKGE